MMMAARAEEEGGDDAAEPAGLWERLRERDEACFESLVQTIGPRLYRAAYGLVGDAHAADEAVQETLLVLWQRGHRLPPGTSLRSWVFAVLANQCRKQGRAHCRWLRMLGRLRRHAPATASGAEPSAAMAEDVDLAAALATLGEGLRQVVVLRHMEGLSVRETASALNLPPGTVKRRTHEALACLRDRLRREERES